MRPPLITLTTDFGGGSVYVAQLKGRLLTLVPHATLVDLRHDVAPHDIREGAILLAGIVEWFPPGTLHLAVVDPGVGTRRRLLYAFAANQHWLAPDNGLLDQVLTNSPPERLLAIDEAACQLPPGSNTFHGRDILAPAAARTLDDPLRGPPGAPTGEWEQLAWPAARRAPGEVRGEVVSIDSFGNALTNIPRAALPVDAPLQVTWSDQTIRGLRRVYGDAPVGTLLALIGSSDQLELAVVAGKAASIYGIRRGDPIVVTWPDSEETPTAPPPPDAV